MKKFMLIAFLLGSKFAWSQNINLNGKVSDGAGKPIPYAFVSDAAHNGTYTNADGLFNLNATPPLKLNVTAKNFNDNTVSADGKTDVNVVLTPGTAANNNTKIAAKNFFQTNTNNNINTSGSLYLKSAQQEVHGSRYLFDKWVHGYAISPADSLIQSNDYLFNYDKIAGNLLFTTDQQNVFIGEKGQVKAFVLFDDNLQAFAYDRLAAIGGGQYIQVIGTGPRYSIYKQTITKFEANNYSTNGITTTGHNYDEYQDNDIYYVVKAGGQPVKIALKKKSLKEAFAADVDKLNKYMSANDGDIDETYLKGICEALNK